MNNNNNEVKENNFLTSEEIEIEDFEKTIEILELMKLSEQNKENKNISKKIEELQDQIFIKRIELIERDEN